MTITFHPDGRVTGGTIQSSGNVIQVKQAENASQITQTTSSDFEIVTVQINPTAVGNKIFIFGCVMGVQNGSSNNNNRFMCRVNSDVGGNLMNADANHWLHSTTQVMRHGGFSINYVDTATTTNTVTYKLIGRWADTSGSQCFVNKDNNSGSTTITVMEVVA